MKCIETSLNKFQFVKKILKAVWRLTVVIKTRNIIYLSNSSSWNKTSNLGKRFQINVIVFLMKDLLMFLLAANNCKLQTLNVKWRTKYLVSKAYIQYY